MSKISVCLATFNEEKNIKDCLESVKWAGEIVIVDGSSKDKTVKIARKYTDKIIIRENPLMFHLNKQKAFEAATGDWILYLDADERVTPALKEEILEVVKSQKSKVKSSYNGYYTPRKNIIFGKWIKHTGWWPDYQLRFFRRGKAYLPCKSVHEQPKLSGKVGYLKNSLIHYNYQTISQFVRRLNDLYTENDKNVFLTKGEKIKWMDVIRFPLDEFLKRFFKEEGYRDGLHGLVLSFLQAFSALITFAKIWETQGFKEIKEEKFLEKVKKEFAGAKKEWRYWFLTSQISEEKNSLKRLSFKIKRRLGRF